MREIATDLKFPEGPVAMADGSVVLVEIAAGALTRVMPDGTKKIVATPGGGPNGLAMGPDGKCYVCNNGGFKWHEAASGSATWARPAAATGTAAESGTPRPTAA